MSPDFQIRWLVIFLLGISFLGCNSGVPPVVPVSGTLTFKGHPIANLEVLFFPAVGPPSSAMSDSSGRFKLILTPDQDGAVVGIHTVFVAYDPPDNPADESSYPAPSNLDEILAKYGNQSTAPIKVEITEAVDNLVIKLD